MAKQTDGSDSFDLDRFRKLLQLMEKYGVTEANLSKGDECWKVRRGPRKVAVPAEPAAAAQPAAAVPPPQPAAPSQPAAEPAGKEPAANTFTIDAPTVGTFYSAASPDDPPFVTVGSVVHPDTIVCIIEAMKVFNQIPAEKSGRIVEILVENGDPVEYGQPLFRLEPV